jgi:ABC-2 type transport system permease protein
MSALAVARKDFKAASRSRTLWTVAVLLGMLAALMAYAYQGYQTSDIQTVREMFRQLGIILSFLLPLVALVASYLSIAGEREDGGIKFLLSLPNTRRDVLLGKLLSRQLLVVCGVVFMFVSAVSVSLARHGTLPVGLVLSLLAITVVYGAVFVGVAVAFSSAVASRSRAIGGSIASYFVLVVLYIFPMVRIPAIVQWLHHGILGMEPNLALYDAVKYTSPVTAYQKSLNLVLPEPMEMQVFSRPIPEGVRASNFEPDLPFYLSDEFSLVVFAVWLVVPLVAGYWLFERADLE